jgi:predicted enzyme related to lactoylglutathione lyase
MPQPNDLSDASVGQLMIPVSDLDRAIAFYRDTLGCRFLFSAPPQMSFFMTGNVRLLVGVPEKPERLQHGGAVYFRVSDIQAVHDTLVKRGVKFVGKPQLVHRTATSELWLAEFADPDGNMLALMSEIAKTP